MTMAVTLADGVLTLAAMPAAFASAYLGILAVCSRRPARVSSAPPTLRFDVVVPAHDEAAVIAETIASLAALSYPADRYRVTVVADNCTDRTAAIARGAGVRVLERADAERRGKGYALAFAFADCLDTWSADAIVVVDADTLVSADLLSELALPIARGEQAVQSRYGVRNAGAGWRNRLMSLAFVLFHDVRSLARERLGLSCGLRGNGMCLTRRTLARVPFEAHSLVEDVEYGIDLGLAGVRVAYAHDAVVRGEMPAGATASRTQRSRWEHGRAQLRRRRLGALMRSALGRRDAVTFDLALDLLVPPLTTLVVMTALGVAASAVAWSLGWSSVFPSVVWGVAALGIVVHVARGCMLAEGGARVVADLAWAPVYIAWKVLSRRSRRDAPVTEWIRTSREVNQ